jgi:poly(A)-specific ribonuclease
LSRPTFIQILPYDEAREASYKSSRQNTLNAQIAKQTGLRWIVEAMVGGDLSGINPMDCAQNMTGESIFVDKEAIASQIRGLCGVLRGHQTVLVGHNLLIDLINFYKTFIGDLPEKVEDFQKAIHQIFPM